MKFFLFVALLTVGVCVASPSLPFLDPASPDPAFPDPDVPDIADVPIVPIVPDVPGGAPICDDQMAIEQLELMAALAESVKETLKSKCSTNAASGAKLPNTPSDRCPPEGGPPPRAPPAPPVVTPELVD
ncbi:myb-related transcription factor, partner of profilin-like [Contarinia nasturtii]|uniref:myb-related transcription factor, partner of profilin-like n=1 Tax=Contarinia nasturtii TaxID=265458 RepID=UPI0012D44A64|nr:myb-related transcription factor, partner of profilin-like [Contarinia nasturtii]